MPQRRLPVWLLTANKNTTNSTGAAGPDGEAKKQLPQEGDHNAFPRRDPSGARGQRDRQTPQSDRQKTKR